MNHVSFGSLLREARLKNGYELNDVSRRLRIRPDILQAIERSDFQNMPPTGYARNMVGAYARLVGLDPAEMINMYHDESYAFQIGQAHRSMSSRYLERNISHAVSRPSAAARRANQGPYSTGRISSDNRMRYSANGENVNNFGRRLYTDEPDYSSPMLFDESQVHRSRRPIINEGRYGNMALGGSRSIIFKSRIPKVPIIIGIVVVVLLIIILFLANTCSQSNTEQQNIPVTGVESTEDTQQQEALPAAPTQFAFAYSVAEGSESWIEVYIDDEVQEAADVTGPAEGQYTCSGTLRFVSSETNGITVTIDGVEQQLEPNDNGIISVTYSFEDILNQWYTDHPEIPRPNTNASNASTSEQSAAGDTAAETDQAADNSSNVQA